MAHEEAVTLDDIWVHYNSTPILEGINLSIEQNDFLGIIGPNGGGKTTLLKVILGLITPSHGRVLVLGKTPQSSRGSIGYVPRYSRAGLFRRYSSDDRTAALNALQTVGMLDHKDHQMGKLSGGEQQRVLIARALVSEPKLLLLDEPTASVDSTMQTEFYELLDMLKHRMAIVLVSHDISAVSVYVDKIACLNRQLFHHGSPEIEAEVLEATYKCPVQMIAHGTVPHRVLKEH